VTVGGTFPGIVGVVGQDGVRAFVRAHEQRSLGGTHFVMTGYDNRQADNGGLATKPSLGSIVSRVRGASREGSGVPTYVRLPGNTPPTVRRSWAPATARSIRMATRYMLLNWLKSGLAIAATCRYPLDRMNRESDRSGLMQGLDQFEEQAFNLVFGNATKAFDTKDESSKTIERYGKGLGEYVVGPAPVRSGLWRRRTQRRWTCTATLPSR
jgi:hypothetical protein